MVTSWSTASVKITQWSKNSVVERALSSYPCGLGSNSRSNFRSRLTLLMAPPFSDGLSPCSPVFLIPQPFKFSFHLNARVRELSLLCFVGTLITGALHAMKCSEILKYCRKSSVTNTLAFTGISKKEDNLARNTEIFGNFLPELSVAFDFPRGSWLSFVNLRLNFFDNFRNSKKLSRQVSVAFLPVKKFSEVLVEWKVLDRDVHICFTVNNDLQLWVENVKNVSA